MTYCGKCGTKNPDDCIYCFKCGAVLHHEGVEAPAPEVRSNAPEEPVPGPVMSHDEQVGPSVEPETGTDHRPTEEEVREALRNANPADIVIVGRNIKTDPDSIDRYRTYTWLCIIITFLCGFVFLFMTPIHYDGLLDGLDLSLYDIAFGGYEAGGPINILYVIAVILLLLSFLPLAGAFNALVGMIMMFCIGTIVDPMDAVIGTLEVTYEIQSGSVVTGVILVFLILVFGFLTTYYMEKATAVEAIKNGKFSFGAMMSFYSRNH